MNPLQKKVVNLCRISLIVLAGCQLAALTALAQADTNEPVKMKPTVVTGSLIPTAETVGAAPVDIVGAQAIERVGSQDVLDSLKKLSPSFSGNGNIGQSLNNGGGGEAYVALRNLPTLVLLDGRRLANSAFSSGALVDLNTIPLAMIDRVEVLKDGSSALYGSEAIGGVINIITKKNFTGVDIGGRYGFATRDGTSITEKRAYVVGGTSTDKASFVAGAQFYQMDPLLTKDREVASLGVLDLLDKGLFPPSYVSPTYPGRVQNTGAVYDPNDIFTDPKTGQLVPRLLSNQYGTSYVLAGSPYASGAAGYNPAMTTPQVFPGVSFNPQYFYVTNGTRRTRYQSNDPVADYNAYAIAHGYTGGGGVGPYIPIANTPIGQKLNAALAKIDSDGEAAGWPLINTTLLGTYSIQSQDRRQFFANGTYDLFDKQCQLFSEFLYANTLSRSALAPSPMSSLANGNVTIAADSPINPFQRALGATGSGNPRVRTRFIDLGNRYYDNQNDFYHFVGGFKGEFEGGWTYQTAFNYNRNDQLQTILNAPNGAALELATQANPDFPGLSLLTDPAGYVPLYNPFSEPGNNSARTLEALRATAFSSGLSELWGGDASVTGQPLDLPGGKLGFAVGGGFYSETLAVDYDGLTKLGKLIGFNQNFPTPAGKRDSWSAFIETRIPITSEDMDIPALHSLEVTAAGRYETFDPGGDSAVPKVGVRWQPLDKQFTLRGSYSQSFLAPNVFQLFGAPVVSYDYVNAGGNGQVQMNWVSNPNLKPADAENWGAGIVISPDFAKNLTLSVDYYHIKTENDVYRVGAQAVVDDLRANGASSQFASSFRFDDGTTLAQNPGVIPSVANWGKGDRPLRNGAQQETDGLDLRADYQLPFEQEKYGKIDLYGAATVLFNYKYADPDIGGPYQYAGQFTDQGPTGGAQGTLPDYQINAGIVWDFHNFTYTVNARYIPSVEDKGSLHESNKPAPDALNNYTQNGKAWKVPSWYAIDMQLAYEFKKAGAWYDQTRLAVGCNNITDEDAPLIASSSEDNTDKSTYDILGRFVYFEISKKF